MIRIAIVDDDKILCDKMKEELTKYSVQNNFDNKIYVFYDCESIVTEFEFGNDFDIIFLDIEFNDMMNGMQFGDFLRNKLLNAEVTIIFISSIEGYAKQLFQFHPFDFIIKPLTFEKINKCMDSYYKTNFLKNKYFRFMKSKSEHDISVNQIKYLQSKGKKVIMHTRNEDIEFYGMLSNCINEKCFKKFIVIHKSYFVNPLYIERFSYDYVILKGNIKLPISRTYQEIVRERLMNI